MSTSRDDPFSLVTEYYRLLKNLTSKKVSESRDAAPDLVEYLQKYRTALSKDSVDLQLRRHLKTGFWEYTTEKVLDHIKTLQKKGSRSKTQLKESAQLLLKVVEYYPGIDGEYCRPLLNIGSSLVEHVLEVLDSEDDDILEACGHSFATLLRRVIKFRGIASQSQLFEMFHICINRLESETKERRMQRVNFGDLLLDNIRSLEWSLDDDRQTNLIACFAKRLVVLSDNDDRNQLASDGALFQTIANYMRNNKGLVYSTLFRANDGDCLGSVISKCLLRLFGDASLSRRDWVLDLISIFAETYLHRAGVLGNHRIDEGDLRVLQAESMISNLMPLEMSLLSTDIFLQQAKDLSKGDIRTFEDLRMNTLAPHTRAYVDCLCSYMVIQQSTSKERIKLISDRFKDGFILKNAVVLFTLMRRSGSDIVASRKDLTKFAQAAIEHVKERLVLASSMTLNAKQNVLEAFWILSCVEILVQDHALDDGIAERLWDDIVSQVVPLVIASKTLIHLCVLQVLNVLASNVSVTKVISSLSHLSLSRDCEGTFDRVLCNLEIDLIMCTMVRIDKERLHNAWGNAGLRMKVIDWLWSVIAKVPEAMAVLVALLCDNATVSIRTKDSPPMITEVLRFKSRLVPKSRSKPEVIVTVGSAPESSSIAELKRRSQEAINGRDFESLTWLLQLAMRCRANDVIKNIVMFIVDLDTAELLLFIEPIKQSEEVWNCFEELHTRANGLFEKELVGQASANSQSFGSQGSLSKRQELSDADALLPTKEISQRSSQSNDSQQSRQFDPDDISSILPLHGEPRLTALLELACVTTFNPRNALNLARRLHGHILDQQADDSRNSSNGSVYVLLLFGHGILNCVKRVLLASSCQADVDDAVYLGLESVFHLAHVYRDDITCIQFCLNSLEVIADAINLSGGRLESCEKQFPDWLLTTKIFFKRSAKENQIVIRDQTGGGGVTFGVAHKVAIIRCLGKLSRKLGSDSACARCFTYVFPWCLSYVDSSIELIDEALKWIEYVLQASEDHERLFNDIMLGRDSVESADPDNALTRRTTAILLCSLAIHSRVLFRVSMAELAKRMAKEPELHGFGPRLLRITAEVSAFVTPGHLFVAVADEVWHAILSDFESIRVFTHRAYGFRSLASAVQCSVEVILTNALFLPTRDATLLILDEVAEVLSGGGMLPGDADKLVSHLIKENQASLIGALMPMVHSGSEGARKAIDLLPVLCNGAVQSNTITSLTMKQMSIAVSHGLILCCFGSTRVNPDDVRSFIRTSLGDSITELNCCDIILRIGELLHLFFNRGPDLERLGNIYGIFLSWIPSELLETKETLLKLAILLPLRLLERGNALKRPTLIESACTMIQVTLKRISFRSSDPSHVLKWSYAAVKALGDGNEKLQAVQELSRTLVEFLKNTARDSKDKDVSKAIQSFLKAFPLQTRVPGQCGQNLGLRLGLNPSFDESACLDHLRTINQYMDEDWLTFSAWLSGWQSPLSDHDTTCVPASVQRYLRPFAPVSDYCTVTGAQSEDAQYVPEFINLLLEMCGSDCPLSVRLTAGQCLTRLQPWLARASSSRMCRSLPEVDEMSMRSGVISWLSDLVLSADVTLAHVASETLYVVLSTPQAKGALNSHRSVADWNLSDEDSRTPSLSPLARMKLEQLGWRPIGTPANALSEDRWSVDIAYDQWICVIAEALCRDPSVTSDPYLSSLSAIVMLDCRFARMIFPWLVWSCVSEMDNRHAVADFSKRFNEVLGSDSHDPSTKQMQRLLVETLSFLRGQCIRTSSVREIARHRAPTRSTEKHAGSSVANKGHGLSKDYRSFWLDVDLLHVARVAVSCGLPATALMNVELFREVSHASNSEQAIKKSSTFPDPKRMKVSKAEELDDFLEQERSEADLIALEAFKLLGDIDGMSSIPGSLELKARTQDAALKGDWITAAVGYDQLMLRQWRADDGLSCTMDYATSLGHLGLTNTAYTALRDQDATIRMDLLDESEWRYQGLTMLDTRMTNRLYSESFHGLMCRGLRCSLSTDVSGLSQDIELAKTQLLDMLYETESADSLSKILARLGNVIDLETICNVFNKSDSDFAVRLEQRNARSEESLAAKEAMLNTAMRVLPDEQRKLLVRSSLGPCLVTLSEVFRSNGRSALALGALSRLEELKAYVNVDVLFRTRVLAQKAMAVWSDGDGETAITAVKRCVQVLERGNATSTSKEILSAVRTLVGYWLNKSESSSSKEVCDWLEHALNEMDDDTASDIRGEAHACLGTFLDRQVRSLEARMSSPEWKTSLEAQSQRERELAELKREAENAAKARRPGESDSRRRNLVHRIERLTRECRVDQTERKSVEDMCTAYLKQAFKHLLESLRFEPFPSRSQAPFRLLHLWFAHSNMDELSCMVRDAFLSQQPGVSSVPTCWLVPLTYQLCSRLSDASAPRVFASTLKDLMVRLGQDHPWHVLPHLFSLQNSDKLANEAASAAAANSFKKSQASEVISRISSHSNNHRRTCDGLQSLYSALIKVAYHAANEKTKQPRPLTDVSGYGELIGKIPANFLPAPAKAYPIRASKDYFEGGNDRLLLRGFGQKYKVAENGISAPKIVTVETTTGKSLPMLVKGKDDLRQDVVMEQLLGYVSSLLESPSTSEKTRHRTKIRTYQVLALTPEAGIIEWVENTTSLGNYLHGGNQVQDFPRSAHARHNVGDWTYLACMLKLKDSVDSGKGAAHRLAIYREVRAHFRPALRHFFYERFGQDPMSWFERREAFTRSTAANSMVGMVLGIGDRHSQNILIDENTAEVIHIDFGITFEQGKTLKTPETVPFRLTPDVIDGFGTSGVKGTFTRACEDTLSVLRENAETILTICEVFVHDPLHKWTVSQKKHNPIDITNDSAVIQSQRANAKTMPVLEASRVLSRIKQKLQGTVDNEGDALSVPAQVKRAIQEATDENNLAALYHGWAPFL